MRIYVDTEFMEDGRTIDLLSLGAVREDGAMFYALSAEADLTRANPWVVEHVVPYLRHPLPEGTLSIEGVRSEIATVFRQFCGTTPEFWGYFADYDWVAICQLYGRMIDLPTGWPQFCRDVKQEMARLGVTREALAKIVVTLEHHALADALWTQKVHAFLVDRSPRAKRGPYARRNSAAVS